MLLLLPHFLTYRLVRVMEGNNRHTRRNSLLLMRQNVRERRPLRRIAAPRVACTLRGVHAQGLGHIMLEQTHGCCQHVVLLTKWTQTVSNTLPHKVSRSDREWHQTCGEKFRSHPANSAWKSQLTLIWHNTKNKRLIESWGFTAIELDHGWNA